MLCIGLRATYFGKLLELVVKWAKIDGCKPTFQAKTKKMEFHFGKVYTV
jgi:hypothetical protein